MLRKGKLCLVIMLIVVMFVTANAEGLFPEMNEMFGTAMPSVGLAIGREAFEKGDTDGGYQERYVDFTEANYLTFGQYLSGIGAKVNEYKIDGSTMTAAISARGSSMLFSYDWVGLTATAIYYAGTRVETESELVEPKDSILPPVGGIMPSAEFAINRKPDEQVTDNGQQIQKWNEFSDDDYNAFSAYLGEIGAELKNSNISDGVIKAEIGLNGYTFSFVFDWNEQTVQLIYPEGTVPETRRWNTPVGNGSVLPILDSIGRELPRVSVALEREPSSTEALQNGDIKEIYKDFSETDYNTFSQHLQKKNCTLDDYHTDDNGTLIIHLSNGSGNFTFMYDAVRQIGTVVYPNQTRVEKAWTLTPTPAPTETPKPVQTEYTQNECLTAARHYFFNLRWKNPRSVKIHDYSSTYSNGSYKFTFDYSAENGFGGTNRGYYWITVDASTKRVTNAFGDE